MNSRSYTVVDAIVFMVEVDLFGAESAIIHAQNVPQITGVGVPSKLRTCHIDMKGHKVPILILHACSHASGLSSKQLHVQNTINQ